MYGDSHGACLDVLCCLASTRGNDNDLILTLGIFHLYYHGLAGFGLIERNVRHP